MKATSHDDVILTVSRYAVNRIIPAATHGLNPYQSARGVVLANEAIQPSRHAGNTSLTQVNHSGESAGRNGVARAIGCNSIRDHAAAGCGALHGLQPLKLSVLALNTCVGQNEKPIETKRTRYWRCHARSSRRGTDILPGP